jgi:hypothetical protein
MHHGSMAKTWPAYACMDEQQGHDLKRVASEGPWHVLISFSHKFNNLLNCDKVCKSTRGVRGVVGAAATQHEVAAGLCLACQVSEVCPRLHTCHSL